MSLPDRIHGFHPVREALRHRPDEVREVWIGEGRGGARARQIEDLARRHGAVVRRVPERELGAPAAVHNGFAAIVARASRERPERSGDREFQVLVEDLQDPRNLGALLRVCEGAGVGRVLVRDRGSAPLSETAVKASAGASEWLTIERIPNSARAIEELQRDGFWIYGLAAGGVAPWEVDLRGKVLLCLGGEADGLRELTRHRCDRLLGLPMRGHVESLNVATAAAAVLYEAVRQRLGQQR